MKNCLKNSNIKKILIISTIFLIVLGISVFAGNVKLNSVNIKFSNNQEITVMTSKTKVQDILNENHIVLEENEKVYPSLESEITNKNEIIISTDTNEPVKIAENVSTEIDKAKILENYTNINN